MTACAPLQSDRDHPPVPEEAAVTFDEAGLPPPDVYLPLLDAFYRTMCQHFPCVSQKRMEERMATGTMSAFLLNGTVFLVSCEQWHMLIMVEQLFVLLVHGS
jgi:hypothetical protein